MKCSRLVVGSVILLQLGCGGPPATSTRASDSYTVENDANWEGMEQVVGNVPGSAVRCGWILLPHRDPFRSSTSKPVVLEDVMCALEEQRAGRAFIITFVLRGVDAGGERVFYGDGKGRIAGMKRAGGPDAIPCRSDFSCARLAVLTDNSGWPDLTCEGEVDAPGSTCN